MATRPSADDLERCWSLAETPTERVWFRQTYVDPKTGPDGWVPQRLVTATGPNPLPR